MTVKKNALFPHEYDEVSLVDEGAAGSAHVLIAKRNKVSKVGPGKQPRATKKKTGITASQKYAQQSGLMKKPGAATPKKSSGRSQSNPCSTKTNSTGAKNGKSTRSKNWQEGKHPRDEKGRMAKTSAESKSKNGKGGTTKSKLDAACRSKKKGGGTTASQKYAGKIGQLKKSMSSLGSWDSDAHVRALMERKPSNGR